MRLQMSVMAVGVTCHICGFIYGIGSIPLNVHAIKILVSRKGQRPMHTECRQGALFLRATVLYDGLLADRSSSGNTRCGH